LRGGIQVEPGPDRLGFPPPPACVQSQIFVTRRPAIDRDCAGPKSALDRAIPIPDLQEDPDVGRSLVGWDHVSPMMLFGMLRRRCASRERNRSSTDALGNHGGSLWNMRNGYALCT